MATDSKNETNSPEKTKTTPRKKAASKPVDAEKKPAKAAKAAAPKAVKEAKKPAKAAPAKAAKAVAPEPVKEVKKTSTVSLVTGFPGFLATHLALEIAKREPLGDLHFLIEKRFQAEAQKRLARIRRESPEFTGNLELIHGDITKPQLGLEAETYDSLRRSITHVWHLAAIYDLAVPEEIAFLVNVGGTVNVLDFCESCTSFKHLNYVSTCYVSGKRTGLILEGELDEGQPHHNNYESTKFWAEMEVQRRLDTIPTTIFRPAIVVGHSRTGETDKYDGPYYLLKIIDRMPKWMPFMNVGRGDTVVNIVPVDFASSAVAELGLRDASIGEVFQLADPNPMRARDITALGLKCLGRRLAVGMIPPALANRALKNDAIEKMVGVPREILGYFTHDARYDASNTARALQGAKIKCPHLSTYLQTLVDYYQSHPEGSDSVRQRA
jgi:thioester reductase-like protein